MSSKRIPSWYRLFLERKLIRLEAALKWLDIAENTVNAGFTYTAKIDLSIAKRILNQ